MSPEIESESIVSREEVSTFLRQLADGLERSDPAAISIEGRRVTIDPPERLELEVEIEDESKRFGRGERSLEIELSWKRTAGDRPILP